jgi:transcriptional regulator with XRE-family HTH domain
MSSYSDFAAALRDARRARALSITQLAELASVSPRLISEMERGQRPHVSLETALRLMALVGAEVQVGRGRIEADESTARRARAEHRRRTWTGFTSTLAEQDNPPPPATPVARLAAVADASTLLYAIQQAPHRHARVAEGAPTDPTP